MTTFQLHYNMMTRGKLTSERRKVRRFLEGAGLYEAITYSLTSAESETIYG